MFGKSPPAKLESYGLSPPSHTAKRMEEYFGGDQVVSDDGVVVPASLRDLRPLFAPLARPVTHVDVDDEDPPAADLGSVMEDDCQPEHDSQPELTEPPITFEYLSWSLQKTKNDLTELQIVATGWLNKLRQNRYLVEFMQAVESWLVKAAMMQSEIDLTLGKAPSELKSYEIKTKFETFERHQKDLKRMGTEHKEFLGILSLE